MRIFQHPFKMASGDQATPPPPNVSTGNKGWPFVGALHGCFNLCWGYMKSRSFAHSDHLYLGEKSTRKHTVVLAFCCFFVGLLCNMKLEVMLFNGASLPSDMHIILMSFNENLYIDEIDTSKVTVCVEASDLIVLNLSCLFILISKSMKSPTSEYLFLPWLGMSIRGVLTRQIPTVGAFLYAIAVIDKQINLLFLANYASVFVLECRIWLDMIRLLKGRWERKDFPPKMDFEKKLQVETLWSCGETDSVEMQNFVY